jgi:hypothetical protein
MLSVTISQIVERLQKFPPEKLSVVYDFVSYLAERSENQLRASFGSETFQTMLASESVLGRDWNRPEEDSAWANL